MKNLAEAEEWLRRAKSNLERAKLGRATEGILYEDVCFDCQQAVEKSLKGLLVYMDVNFPWTHSITRLIELIDENNIDVPEDVKDSIILTVYAVSTRYPGKQEPVDKDEYREAFQIAERVCSWARAKLDGQ